ncbi:hypothetical protein DF186_24020 [Enterococcus hirae]|nr:hypothetical protein DF186_24020 [Enterococcus hirae]
MFVFDGCMTGRRSGVLIFFDSEPERIFLRLRREVRGKKVVGAEEEEEFFEINMEDNMEIYYEEEE